MHGALNIISILLRSLVQTNDKQTLIKQLFNLTQGRAAGKKGRRETTGLCRVLIGFPADANAFEQNTLHLLKYYVNIHYDMRLV